MEHEDDGDGGSFVAFRLDDGGDADPGLGKDGGDAGEDAGAVDDGEADVIRRGDLVHGDDLDLAGGVGDEGGDALVAAVVEVQGGVGDVTQDRAGGGVATGTAAVEEGFTNHVAADGDGVEGVVDGGKDVVIADEGGIDGDEDTGFRSLGFRGSTWRGARHDGLDDPEELDGVAEASRGLDVEPGHVADAFDVDLIGSDPEAVGEGGEDAGLVGGVVAIDVEGGIGLGVSETLGIGEDGGEFGAFELHPGEDVIAGAVDDAADGLDAVADEGFAEDLDDGDAAGDGGLVVEVGGVGTGGLEEFLSVGGEKGLVGGDNGFAVAKGGKDDLAGGGGAAHEFDDEMDGRVMDDRLPVLGQEVGGDAGGLCFLEVANGDTGDGEPDAEACGEHFAPFDQGLDDGASDRACADQTDVHLLHHAAREPAEGREGGGSLQLVDFAGGVCDGRRARSVRCGAIFDWH